MCGGFDSFSLYDLEEGELPSPPTDDNYVGCFADDRNDRVLGAKSSSSEMTSEVDRQAGLHRFWKNGNTPYTRNYRFPCVPAKRAYTVPGILHVGKCQMCAWNNAIA